PCKKADRELLAGMMETVEDIPKEAILHGLPWNWDSYGDYLNAIEELGPSINVCGLVGHCATRFYVMGERAIEEPADYRRGWTPLTRATEDEIREIAKLAGQSVKEGAMGFSSNRLPGHRLPDGRSIPGTFAHRDELRAIAKAVGAYGGIMQMVTDFKEFEEEMELVADEARSARGVLFSMPTEAGIDTVDAKIMAMRAEDLNVTAVTVPRSGGGIGGLSNGNFFRTRAWRELHKLDLTARLKAIRDPATRERLVNEVKERGPVAGYTARWYWLGDGPRPCYTHELDQNLDAMAAAAGEHPVETWLRIADESDGKAWFHMRGFNMDLGDVERLIQKEWAIPGLGDAGAHVTGMIDSGWSTFVLSHWHRDSGVYSLQEAVRRISAIPAGVLGLDDRGTLAVGKRADVNIFDIDRLEERMPEIVNDFPGGAPRFTQRAVGYKTTVCNGQIVLQDDELTGLRAGRVLRSN
ncbi:MAG: amidohydrolase family protein, partial [Gammaproteobacteria bacterium]|nr:amidohydrolase family protein [Gammaproteobacteria bacterium]